MVLRVKGRKLSLSQRKSVGEISWGQPKGCTCNANRFLFHRQENCFRKRPKNEKPLYLARRRLMSTKISACRAKSILGRPHFGFSQLGFVVMIFCRYLFRYFYNTTVSNDDPRASAFSTDRIQKNGENINAADNSFEDKSENNPHAKLPLRAFVPRKSSKIDQF